jgi:hypothetical protein
VAGDPLDAGSIAGAVPLNRPPWVGSYVGLPFSDDGLTRSGLHCWGLVRLVLMEQAGLEVPSYGESSAADLLDAARHFRDGPCNDLWPKAVEPFRPFDVVLMTAMETVNGATHRLPAHCGVMCSETEVLHIWRETHSVIMARDHPRIRHKIIGTYRHRDLQA